MIINDAVSADTIFNLTNPNEGLQLLSPGNFAGQINLSDSYIGFMNVFADSYFAFPDGTFTLYVGQTPVDTIRLNTKGVQPTVEINIAGIFVSLDGANQSQPGGVGTALPQQTFQTPPATHFVIDGDQPIIGTPSNLPGISWQFAQITAANLGIAATTPNVFIQSGAGANTIDVSQANGNNILISRGTNDRLIGGTGRDVFIIDTHNPTVKSLIENFHANDAVFILGVTPQDFLGETVSGANRTFAVSNAAHSASVTLAGTSGQHLTTNFVNDANGNNYLSIQVG